MLKFIIEHLDFELFEWSLIEYKHISKIVGKGNLVFSNIGNKKDKDKLNKYGTVFEKSVLELDLKNICVLDMSAEKKLDSDDKNKFDYFVFGGILGDDPPQQRTQQLINTLKKKKKKYEIRNLGKKQMSTDTAVFVTKKILDGGNLEKIEFKDGIEIEVRDGESVMLPYRYVVENGNPIYSDELVEYLKRKEGF